MNTRRMTLDQIYEAGLDALSRELGPVGMIRFLQQLETGKGDYTKERSRILGKSTVNELAREIRLARKRGRKARP